MGSSNNPKAGCGGAVFVVLFVGFWSAITLAFDVVLVVSAWRQTRAVNYPSVVGAVVYSRVQEHSDSDGGTTYSPDVRYVYTVEGREYHGDRYRYGQMASSDRNADRVVASLPVGREVPVFYNPADPADAVLKAGIEGADLFLAMFLTPFNLVMLGGWYAVGRGAYVRFVKPPAGGARLIDQGFRTHVYSSSKPLLATAAATLLGASFVSIFIVGFGFGFNPPVHVIAGTWTVVLVLTLGVTAAVALRGVAPKELLAIDPVERTITLPARGKHPEPLSIPFAAVEQVRVERRSQRDSEGSRQILYEPTIAYTDEGGVARRARLPRKVSALEAESLAAWLEEQVRGGPGR